MITSQRGTSSDMLSMDRHLHVSTKKGSPCKLTMVVSVSTRSIWYCILIPLGCHHTNHCLILPYIRLPEKNSPTFNSLKRYYPFFRKKKTKTYRSRVGPILLKPPTTIQLGEGMFFLRCNHGFEGTDVCLHASGREVSWFQLQKIISVTHTICLIPHGYITLQA